VLKDHSGREVSLFVPSEYNKEKDKYRFIGNNGVLKIMGRALVYNYTPIPLLVCESTLMPDQFVTIYSRLTIQNIDYKDCKGVKTKHDERSNIYYLYCEGWIIDYANLYY
jgi:hypothetical protein